MIKNIFQAIYKPIRKVAVKVGKSTKKVAKLSLNKIKKNKKSKKLLQVDKRMMYNRKSKISKKYEDVNGRGMNDEKT